MREETFRLIAEVAKRQVLWDTTMKICNRKDLSYLQWREVSEILHIDIPTCKKRFKSLRDCYRSEIRKIQQKRADVSNWPYFRALEFLRNIFDPDGLVPFAVAGFDIELGEPHKLDDFVVDVDSDDSIAFDVMGDIFQRDSPPPQKDVLFTSRRNIIKRQMDVESPHEIKEFTKKRSIPSTAIIDSDTSMRAKRSLRQKNFSVNEESVQLTNGVDSTAKKPPPATETAQMSSGPMLPKDDADYNFLVSLLPHMKKLSDMSNLKFRMEISRILVDLKHEDMQPLQQNAEISTAPTMPKLTPAPGNNLPRRSDPNRYGNTSTNGCFYGESSPVMVECDVKIEGDNTFKDL